MLCVPSIDPLVVYHSALPARQVPGNAPVLHTGDCRLAPHMLQAPALQALRGRGCTLVLDTTYCDPQVRLGI